MGSHASPAGLNLRGAIFVSVSAATLSRYSRSTSSSSDTEGFCGANGGGASAGVVGICIRCLRIRPNRWASESRMPAKRFAPMPGYFEPAIVRCQLEVFKRFDPQIVVKTPGVHLPDSRHGREDLQLDRSPRGDDPAWRAG